MTNTNTGRFAFLRQLLADGITCMFGNPGSSEENLLDALTYPEFKDFKYYLALHEGSVVAMADAYARAAPARPGPDGLLWRRPAVVQLHSYAGLANGLGMMYYARRGYTPMVVIAGEAGLRYEALDGQMAADLVGIARPFVKSDHNGPCAWRVVDPESLLRLLRRAIKAAATPPLGPTFLALPMDVLDRPNAEAPGQSRPVTSRVRPEESTISEAAALLADARKPLILMGDGIAASQAQAELTEVAELLGADVWGGNCSEVNMAASHPLFGGYLGHMFGEDSRKITAGADVVLVCGTTVLPEVFPALQGVFASDARIIHFDLNGYEIAKNFPVTIGALADPKPTLALLAKTLTADMAPAQKQRAGARLAQAKDHKRKDVETGLARDASLFGRVPLHACSFMKELGEQTKARRPLIFDEALTHTPELLRYLPQDEPGTYFQTRAGMLGTGLPGALGLKVAHPDRLVLGFSGDGGSMSTIQSLSTAARHNIGAKFVVCNNRSYRILKLNLQQYWDSLGIPRAQTFPPEFDLSPPELRFDKLAEGQGVGACRVESPQQIGPAITAMLADERPFLIDLILSSELQ